MLAFIVDIGLVLATSELQSTKLLASHCIIEGYEKKYCKMLRLSFEFWICNLTLTMALVYLFLPFLKNCCILNETWSQKYEMLWQSRKVELHSFFPKWFYDQIYVSQIIYNHITLRNLYILRYQFKVLNWFWIFALNQTFLIYLHYQSFDSD